MAPVMRSDSDTVSLMAWPNSRKRLLRLSSNCKVDLPTSSFPHSRPTFCRIQESQGLVVWKVLINITPFRAGAMEAATGAKPVNLAPDGTGDSALDFEHGHFGGLPLNRATTRRFSQLVADAAPTVP